MDDSINALSNLKILLRIQQSRLSSIEKLLTASQQDYKLACSDLNERLGNIQAIKVKISDLHDYFALDEVSSSPERLNRGDAYLFWLKYDLEMHEYYQSQEEERVEEAKNIYLSTKHNWYKNKLKTEKLKELIINHSNAEITRNDELHDESVYEIGFVHGIKAYG